MIGLTGRLRAGETGEAERAELGEVVTGLEREVLEAVPSEAVMQGLPLLAYAYVLGNEHFEYELLELVTDAARDADQEVCAELALQIADMLIRRDRWVDAGSVLAGAEAPCADAPYGLCAIRTKLAQLAVHGGDFGRALDLLGTARAGLGAVSADRKRHAALACGIAGRRVELYFALGLPDLARVAIVEMEAQAPVTGDRRFHAATLIHRCDLLITTQRYEAAALFAEQSLDELTGKLRASMLLRRASAQWELSKDSPEEWTEAARRSFLEALADEALSPEDRITARMQLVDLHFAMGEDDDGDALLEELRSQLPALPELPFELHLYVSELLGRRAFETETDPGAKRRAFEDVRTAFDRFLSTWRSFPRRQGGVAFLHYGTRRRVLSTLMSMAIELERGEAGVRTALELLYEAQSLGSIVRFSAADAGSLERSLATLLDGDQGLLVYVPGRDRTHLFALDAGSLVHLELGTPGSIDKYRVELAAAAQAPPGATKLKDLRTFGGALGKELLPAPIRERLGRWSHVTVVGSELFGYVPFELLPHGGGLLGDRVALSYLPSLPLAVLLDGRAPQPGGSIDLLLAAAPDVHPSLRERWAELEPIPFGPKERRRLTAAFETGRVRVVTGADATRELLSSGEGAGARALHLLTHGVQDLERERSAGLVMAPRGDDAGLLWCEDVEALRVPPLVFVSACGAARGTPRKGEDAVSHLGGAFLSAGARVVVVSAADLDYAAALALAEVFFERVEEHGDAPAEALRRAREALSKREGFADPTLRLIHLLGLGGRPAR